MDDFYDLSDLEASPLEEGDAYRQWMGRFTRQLATFRSAEGQRRKLREKGCPEEFIAPLILMGEQIGGIDDLWYARSLIAQKRSWSLRRIRDELRARGVEGDVIAQAIADEEVSDRDRAYDLALDLVEKGLERQKAIAKLVRLGYSFSLAAEAYDSLKTEDMDQ